MAFHSNAGRARARAFLEMEQKQITNPTLTLFVNQVFALRKTTLLEFWHHNGFPLWNRDCLPIELENRVLLWI